MDDFDILKKIRVERIPIEIVYETFEGEYVEPPGDYTCAGCGISIAIRTFHIGGEGPVGPFCYACTSKKAEEGK